MNTTPSYVQRVPMALNVAGERRGENLRVEYFVCDRWGRQIREGDGVVNALNQEVRVVSLMANPAAFEEVIAILCPTPVARLLGGQNILIDFEKFHQTFWVRVDEPTGMAKLRMYWDATCIIVAYIRILPRVFIQKIRHRMTRTTV